MYVGTCFAVNGAAGDTRVVKEFTAQLQECVLDIAHIPVESKAKHTLHPILPVSSYVLESQTNPSTEENKLLSLILWWTFLIQMQKKIMFIESLLFVCLSDSVCLHLPTNAHQKIIHLGFECRFCWNQLMDLNSFLDRVL